MKSESIGYWDLPQPDIKGYTNQWLPIPKMARTIPFGYVEDCLLYTSPSPRDRG